jgi:hypothetical protein
MLAFFEAVGDPKTWPVGVDDVLRREPVRASPIWARYAIVVVSVPRNDDLAVAAAAFCRDVSKCRRLVCFENQSVSEALPFLALPAVPGGHGVPPLDLETTVNGILDSYRLASAFLDEQIPVSQVQFLAESSE